MDSRTKEQISARNMRAKFKSKADREVRRAEIEKREPHELAVAYVELYEAFKSLSYKCGYLVRRAGVRKDDENDEVGHQKRETA